MRIVPGDIVHYETFMGNVRRVRVTAVYADVKNGRPGFDAECADFEGDSGSVWGYSSQILVVECRDTWYGGE